MSRRRSSPHASFPSTESLRGARSPASRASTIRRIAWEGLLMNEHGRLVQGSLSNLAVVLGDCVVTPPESDGCVPGTVRRRLLEKGVIEERSLVPEDLRAGEVLLMNSLIGVMSVSRIDGG